MTVLTFSLLMTGVMLNAAAQLLLKAGANSIGAFEFASSNIIPVGWKLATEPHIVGGLGCYMISVAVWVVALSRVEVSIAYPLLSVGYVVNAFAAWYLFGEAVTPMRVTGIAVIIVGVWIVARS